ncbi:MAG: cyclic nucleotide-binding domain-containing protein, partial [Proteobacteria bacterium]
MSLEVDEESMSTIKIFKKGETLFREGEKSQNVFFIQSGQVALTLQRQKQTIELCVLGANQIAGEHGLA